MDIELQHKYDEIVGAAYVNIFHLSKQSNIIAIAPFDPKNKEHLFVLSVAKAVASVNSKVVGVDVSRFQLWKLNRGLDKDCRYQKLNGRDYTYAINPKMLLDYMREGASEIVGEENFDFGKIYDSFYKKQKGKR